MALAQKTMVELTAIAKERGLKNYSGKRKAELVAMLLAAPAAPAAAGAAGSGSAGSASFGSAGSPGYTADELDGYTNDRLKDILKSMGFKGYSSMKKAELKATVLQHQQRQQRQVPRQQTPQAVAVESQADKLMALKVDQLRSLAKESGLTGYSSKTKAELVTMIAAARQQPAKRAEAPVARKPAPAALTSSSTRSGASMLSEADCETIKSLMREVIDEHLA